MESFEKKQTIEAIRAIVRARWFFILVSFLQVVAFKFISRLSFPETFPLLAVLLFASLGYNFAYWFFVRRPAEKISAVCLQLVKASQIVIDIFVISLLIYFNGTVNNFSSALYLIVIMMGSVLYQKRGVLGSAVLVGLIYSTLAWLEYFGYFPVNINQASRTLVGNLALFEQQVLVFLAYLIGASISSVFIIELNKRSEKRLEVQRNELLEKAKLLTRQTEELIQTKNWLNEALIKSDKIRLQVDEARQAQEVEKNKVAAVIQNLTDGLLMLDQRGIIILINSQAEKMLEIEKSKIIGGSLPESGIASLVKIDHLLKSGQGLINKKEFPLGGGLETILEISTATVVDLQEKALGQLIVLHDVTREKVVERLKSEFVSIAAHQLRTPLSAVKWALNLVLEGDLGKVPAKQKQTLLKGYQSNERMILLINDLLNVARIEEGRFIYELAKAPFADLVKEALSELRGFIRDKKIKIKIDDFSSEATEVLVDQEKIVLALRNMIENAVKYSPAGSTIKISFGRKENDLFFSVDDEGSGVPAEQQKRLFTKFFRGDNAIKTETEGTGLGLFIAKNIIESHGGQIGFKSQEGKGSTFYFSIPVKT